MWGTNFFEFFLAMNVFVRVSIFQKIEFLTITCHFDVIVQNLWPNEIDYIIKTTDYDVFLNIESNRLKATKNPLSWLNGS